MYNQMYHGQALPLLPQKLAVDFGKKYENILNTAEGDKDTMRSTKISKEITLLLKYTLSVQILRVG